MHPWHKSSQRGSSYKRERACNTILVILIFSLMVVGCNPGILKPINTPQSIITQPQVETTSTVSPTNTVQPPPTFTPTQTPIRVWLPGYLPEKMRSVIALPEGYSLAETLDEADIALQVGDQNEAHTSHWVYALVAPFPTVTDVVSAEELKNAWEGTSLPAFNNAPLLMDEHTTEALAAYWGDPAPGAVQVLATDELVDYAWSNRPSWGIVPFEELNPRWKVLAIDGKSPIRKDFDPAGYPLNIPFVLSNNGILGPEVLNIPSTNRDASRLTTVAMTGVTAMVRATAYAMEHYGVTYPAEDIGPLLTEADITHISNEIPFAPNCPYPKPIGEALVFCSNPKYIDLLKAVGTDIVELTGDHFMDYGADATLFTLQMYDELGWPYYGGGADAEEARQPVLFEHNGNKIAFMGCNIGCEIKTSIPCTAIATDSHPGAAKCDFDWISSEISRLRQEGYQVIFTFQHIEYYKYTIESFLEKDFGRVADAGAVIVSGSQAHQPHGFAFENGSYIHYGLGNLFFDQYHYCAYFACDDAFIDRHVFYDGQYISTELITLHFVDWARPRLMTPDERVNFLEIIFNASGW
jgi:hypothetical protein